MKTIENGSSLVAVTATTEVIRGAPRVRVNLAYTAALAKVGLVPLVVPPLPAAAARVILAGVAGLLVTGGEDVAPERYGEDPHPTVDAHEGRDESEIALILEAQKRRVPTLAICRGIQVANVALGGTLVQDIPSQLEKAISHDAGDQRDARVHEVHVERNSRLAAALGTDCLTTNSFHHQALAMVPSALCVTAHSISDGVIEGAESADPSWWMLAVQWHPEELTETAEPWDRNLFEAFAKAVLGRR
ncbi:MAG TPA: gamma-glutamyl-gamma-aminobutyrate hydrolase family protein [Gemmatimonadaceae bacterium]|jgi:putative glutamine amidotransferase